MMLQLPGGPAAPTWSRAAIHDSVAAIARQRPYWRNPRTSPIERMLQWIVEQLERFFRAVDSVPHGRRIATVAAVVLAVLVIARLAYATRLRGEPLVGQRLHRSRRQLSPDAWHEAEGLAAAGEYTAAAHALYRAALALLSARGLVRLRPAVTTRESCAAPPRGAHPFTRLSGASALATTGSSTAPATAMPRATRRCSRPPAPSSRRIRRTGPRERILTFISDTRLAAATAMVPAPARRVAGDPRAHRARRIAHSGRNTRSQRRRAPDDVLYEPAGCASSLRAGAAARLARRAVDGEQHASV